MIKPENNKNEFITILLFLVFVLIIIVFGLWTSMRKYQLDYQDLKMKHDDLQIILDACLERNIDKQAK